MISVIQVLSSYGMLLSQLLCYDNFVGNHIQKKRTNDCVLEQLINFRDYNSQSKTRTTFRIRARPFLMYRSTLQLRLKKRIHKVVTRGRWQLVHLNFIRVSCKLNCHILSYIQYQYTFLYDIIPNILWTALDSYKEDKQSGICTPKNQWWGEPLLPVQLSGSSIDKWRVASRCREVNVGICWDAGRDKPRASSTPIPVLSASSGQCTMDSAEKQQQQAGAFSASMVPQTRWGFDLENCEYPTTL